MLDHGIILVSRFCRLRPLKESDEPDVLSLWNQDYVVGNLFMSKTTTSTYRKYFEIYKVDPNDIRFAVEDSSNEFVGTIGYKCIDNTMAEIGMFALYPTKDPVLVALQVLLLDHLFLEKAFAEIVFTLNTNNVKIKKFHTLFGAVKTSDVTKKVGSNGLPIVLEHWKYLSKDWQSNRGTFVGVLA